MRGQKNVLAWRVAGGTGVQAFEIELHHWSRKVMNGAFKIATRFPNEPLPGRYANLGGEIEVDLGADVPAGDGFVISFSSSFHGKVYAVSEPFSILEAPPSNHTDRPQGLPEATVTATITNVPNPTDQWPLTLTGQPDSTDAP